MGLQPPKQQGTRLVVVVCVGGGGAQRPSKNGDRHFRMCTMVQVLERKLHALFVPRGTYFV